MNDAQINTLMAPSLTAAELVNIAHVLIDRETAAWAAPGARPDFHAGALKGITAMCAAATSALNACGGQESRPAPAVPANPGTSTGTNASRGLAAVPAPAVPAPEVATRASGLTAEKVARLVKMQRRACDILEASGVPTQVEAAGDLRSATCNLAEAVDEQLAISALPSVLDDWMTTPAGLTRVLVGALRSELTKDGDEFNDGVECCITALVGTLSAGAGADKGSADSARWAELSAMAPKISLDDIAGALAQLRITGESHGKESSVGQSCLNAMAIIEGLLPHAGAGVEA